MFFNRRESILEKKIIFFIGESGIGKTTLMEALLKINPEKFYMPPLYTTRPIQERDDRQQVKNISVPEIRALNKNSQLLIFMSDGKTSYCYLKGDISDIGHRVILLNGSPYVLNEMKGKGIIALIEGDSAKGLKLRNGCEKETTKRKEMNRKLSDLFYNKTGFREQVDIIFQNNFAPIATWAFRFDAALIACR